MLIRHAEPDEVVRGRCYSRTDCGLSVDGVQQAAALAETLGEVPVKAVYSSPLRRALETATPIAARHELELVTNGDLTEIDVGDFEGVPWAEIEEAEPIFWTGLHAGYRFPGGEDYAELSERACRVLGAIVTHHPGETVVIVSHQGVLRAQLGSAFGMTPAEMLRISISCAGVSVVDWRDGAAVVHLLNGDRLPPHLSLGSTCPDRLSSGPHRGH